MRSVTSWCVALVLKESRAISEWSEAAAAERDKKKIYIYVLVFCEYFQDLSLLMAYVHAIWLQGSVLSQSSCWTFPTPPTLQMLALVKSSFSETPSVCDSLSLCACTRVWLMPHMQNAGGDPGTFGAYTPSSPVLHLWRIIDRICHQSSTEGKGALSISPIITGWTDLLSQSPILFTSRGAQAPFIKKHSNSVAASKR